MEDIFKKEAEGAAKLEMIQRDKERAFFLKSFLNLIVKFDHIVIFPHVSPDGDCLGGAFGFQELIRSNFPHKKAYVVGNSFGLYPWMPMEFSNFVNFGFDFGRALAVILDVGQSSRIQQFEKFFGNSKVRFGSIVKIDHHGCMSDFHIDLSWDDPTYASTCCQLVQIADFYGWKLTAKAASFLYLGICTDSMRFSIENVLPRTLILAAKTWRAGADHVNIHRLLGKRTWNSIKMQKHLIDKCTCTGNIIWYAMSYKERKDLGLETVKSLVNTFQNIEENWIWIFFSEDENKVWNVDLRSIHVSVRDLAIKYGGGGHENASGAKIKEEDIKNLINDAEEIVVEAKRSNEVASNMVGWVDEDDLTLQDKKDISNARDLNQEVKTELTETKEILKGIEE